MEIKITDYQRYAFLKGRKGYIKEFTEKELLENLNNNTFAVFQHIQTNYPHLLSKELCQHAVIRDPNVFKLIKPEFQTEEMQLRAVDFDTKNIMLIHQPTKQMYMLVAERGYYGLVPEEARDVDVQKALISSRFGDVGKLTILSNKIRNKMRINGGEKHGVSDSVIVYAKACNKSVADAKVKYPKSAEKFGAMIKERNKRNNIKEI